LGALAALGGASLAQADQCAYVSIGEAEKARKILESVSEMIEYCELCTGDKPKAVRIQDVEVRRVDGADYAKFRELYVNGAPIDLAYVFVPDGDKTNQYRNLSKMAGCKSDSVSTTITYPPEGGKRSASPDGNWAARYVRGVVGWELISAGSGPAYQVIVEFGTEANGNDRGEMRLWGEVKDGVLEVKTPVGTCRYTLSKSGAKLKVLAAGDCGAFGPYLAGEFRAK
jgi:hypothetical protein